MKSLKVSIIALGVGLAFLLSPCRGAQGKSVPVNETVRYEDFSAVDQLFARQGLPVRLFSIEYTTSPDSGQFGGLILAKNVGNKQMSAHWVPGDPRRFGSHNIYWATDQQDGTADVPMADINSAIDSAINTWSNVKCAKVPLVKVSDLGYDLGYLQYLLGYGGVPGWLADLTHAGWLPGEFFDAIVPPDGGDSILGVTFTFTWVAGGVATDIDANGKEDVAFREIYYNDRFDWSVNAPAWNDIEVDLETVVLHESGHGLSQGHFGKVFIDAADKEPPYSIRHLHFAPRAVMNAVYWDTLRDLQNTDVGGHCSIWGSWPVR